MMMMVVVCLGPMFSQRVRGWFHGGTARRRRRERRPMRARIRGQLRWRRCGARSLSCAPYAVAVGVRITPAARTLEVRSIRTRRLIGIWPFVLSLVEGLAGGCCSPAHEGWVARGRVS